MLKQARYSFNVYHFPYWKFTKVAKVFLGALLVTKYVQNAFASYLKLLIEWVSNVVNHHSLAFFKVKQNAQHIIGSKASNKSMDT